MKKIILVAAAILTMASLTACGGETKGSESVSATDTTTAAESTKATNMDVYEFYDLARDANAAVPYEISDKAGAFLKVHSDLFPISADKFLKDNDSDLVDFDLDAKHILKNKEKYGDMLMALPELSVTQIWEGEADNSDGYYSAINATDPSGQQYFILYNGALDVFENDSISCFGLPLDTSSFENTDGGDTLVIVLAGSVIEKIASADVESEARGDVGDIDEDDYILPYSDTQLISEMGSFVQTMTSENIRLAKNEIYARHGRRFKDPELQRYFDAQPWYHGTIEPDEFDEGELNAVEKSNVEILNSMLTN